MTLSSSLLIILAGKTVALKDMISVKDVPMLMGTEFIKGFTPNLDATVTTRILEAGGQILGKTVCENLCHSATSHSAGTCKRMEWTNGCLESQSKDGNTRRV